jgi:tripartite-type tricarboxylate transporter receptor subunit TctC
MGAKMLRSKLLLLAAGATGIMGMMAAPAVSAGFYDGKDVTVIINAGAGGGLTRTGRLFTNYMKKHLGKGANMVIKNVAGAGGIKGMNYLAEKAKPNGLTVLWGTSQQMAQLLKLPGVRFDLSKIAVIGAGSSSYLSIARSDFKPGIKQASDLLKVKKMIVGGRGLTDGLGIFARLPLDILGVNRRYVTGYKSQPKLNAAIRSKEIGLLTTGGIGYIVFYKNTILKSGEGKALYYHSALGADGKYVDPGIYPKDVKHFSEFYKDTHGGKSPAGPLWEAYEWFSKFNSRPFGIYARKDNSPGHIAELRGAFKKTLNDPAFIAAWTKMVRSAPEFGVGKDVSWLLTDFNNVTPGALAGMKKLTARKKK